MHDEPPPRDLQERTGRHLCIRCLGVVPSDVYFRNDYICDECAAGDEYPAPQRPPANSEERKPR